MIYYGVIVHAGFFLQSNAERPIIMSRTVTDNIDIDVTPFKGPFKSKGANRRAVASLRADLDSIHKQMVRIVSSFRSLVPSKVPVYLSIHRPRGIPLLWWRKVGRNSEYVKLFDSSDCMLSLDEFLPTTMQLIVGFDRDRLHYNLQATMVGHSLEHYVKYQNGNEILNNFVLSVATP